MDSAVTKANNRLWRLKQLSHLALPAHIFVPAFLDELHQLVPSRSNSYCWLSKHGKISNVFDELQNGEALQCASMLQDKAHADCLAALTDWIHDLKQPVTSAAHSSSTKPLAKLYRQALLKLGYKDTLFIPVFQPTTTKHGILMLHRAKDASTFSKAEKTLMTHASALLAEGLNEQVPADIRVTDGWQQGIIVIDKTTNVQHACPVGEKLLSLASRHATQMMDANALQPDVRIFKGIDILVDKLMHTEQLMLLAEQEFSLSTTNAWGDFKITGFLLRDTQGSRAPQVCLNIKWQVPFALKLFHNIKHLDLTPRQETTALLYAAGSPTKVIASKLGLSLHTVKEHVQNIFERLQIHSRAELIENILCEEQGSIN